MLYETRSTRNSQLLARACVWTKMRINVLFIFTSDIIFRDSYILHSSAPCCCFAKKPLVLVMALGHPNMLLMTVFEA